MLLSNLIGSLLIFQHNGIGNNEIKCIEADCFQLFSISLSKGITQVYYELSDYDDCFEFEYNKIVANRYYFNNTHLLKKRFFDNLSDDEKRKIYRLINMIE